MTKADEILFSADVQVLYGVLQKLSEYARDKGAGELIPLLLELERFVEIHKVRTNDLVTYREKIDVARTEYQGLLLKYQGTKEALEQTKKVLTNVMNTKMEETNEAKKTDYDF